MPTIDDLSQYITSNDVKGFLLCYMQCVDEGANLSVPTGLEMQPIKEGWEEILPNVTGGYTDEFVDELSAFWLNTVKKQGATVTKTFAKEIIAIIQGKPKPTAAKSPSPKTASASPQGAIVSKTADNAPPPSPQSSASLDTVASEISSHYYSYQTAVESKVLPKDELASQIKLALQHQDADQFLIHYLSYARYKEKVAVPMTSVVSTISQKWEEILINTFGHQPQPEFLKALSAKWFYLVNQRGLPATLEKQEDILYFLMSNYTPKSAAPTNNQPKGMFRKMKSFFGY